MGTLSEEFKTRGELADVEVTHYGKRQLVIDVMPLGDQYLRIESMELTEHGEFHIVIEEKWS